MTMLFYALVLCLASWSVDARNDYVTYIQPYTYTSWGTWGHKEWCPEGSYAYGFSLKVEPSQGTFDDTAVNGIKLNCRTYCGGHDTSSITSLEGNWGYWRSKKCPTGYFLYGAQASSEKHTTSDNTAVNNYKFICKCLISANHNRPTLRGSGMNWGSWTARKDCPTGTYICGIRTQVESRQGSGDDTALNDARFYCCTLKKTC